MCEGFPSSDPPLSIFSPKAQNQHEPSEALCKPRVCLLNLLGWLAHAPLSGHPHLLHVTRIIAGSFTNFSFLFHFSPFFVKMSDSVVFAISHSADAHLMDAPPVLLFHTWEIISFEHVDAVLLLAMLTGVHFNDIDASEKSRLKYLNNLGGLMDCLEIIRHPRSPRS